MALTQADLDNLDRAIASGTRKVTIGSDSIEYPSFDDLKRARDHVASVLTGSVTQQNGIVLQKAVFNHHG